MEINREQNLNLSNMTGMISEILKLYEKIPSRDESEQMIDSFLEKYDLSDDAKIIIKQNLENFKISHFNKEGIINLIQKEIEAKFNLDANNSNKIALYGLEFLKNYVLIAQIKQETVKLKAENEANEIEFSNHLSELNVQINLEIQIKKNKINEFKKSAKNDLQIDTLVYETNLLLGKKEDEFLANKTNNQIDNFLNNNLDEVIEL
ncbi:hypothetical protein ACQ9BO_07785 [Flavobacterium sp. P21]|uniref:hypothetical protein n=1 Tax=Flavobacterium sp. P21 TaxID=3423948 RepID=UPI003D678620